MKALFFMASLAGTALFAVPERHLEFPGSGCTSFATDGRILYAGSGWTRENGASIWDVRDPANMKYAGHVRARGYTTCSPVIVGERVYQSLWFGMLRVNVADPANPVIEAMPDFDFPNHTCNSIWRDGDRLVSVSPGATRVYDVSDPTKPAAFVRRDSTAAKRPNEKMDPRLKAMGGLAWSAKVSGDIAIAFDRNRSSFRSFRLGATNAVELCERFMLHSLSTLAVVGNRAYVHAVTQPMTHGVWTLDLTKSGRVDFGNDAIFRPAPPRNADAFTMLMQSVGAIVDLGDGWLLADDGAVRLDAAGHPAFVGARERPVCNYDLVGRTVALAQSSQVKLLDVSDPAHLREIARWQLDRENRHATDVVLDGEDVLVLVQPRRAKNEGFLVYVPPKSTLVKLRRDGTNLVATASLDLPPSVSCVRAAPGVLYAGGVARYGASGPDRARFTVVDTRAMKILASPDGIAQGAVYKLKRFGGRILFTDAAVGVKELDFADPAAPRVKGVWRRSSGSEPGYDDITVANGRIYALAHSSLDVYRFEDAERAGDVRWTSPRFERYFGAVEKQRLKLKDGFEAVAFGEGGLYVEKGGEYVSEVAPNAAGNPAFSADAVRFGKTAGGRVTVIVTDRSAAEEIEVDVTDPRSLAVVSRHKL